MPVSSPADFFPHPDRANVYGMVAVGGELSPDWLLYAYSHGIFPWPSSERFLTWWSPDPRAMIEFDEFHVPKRLARVCRSGQFEVTCNRDFRGVIQGCATAQGRRHATWLTQRMQQAYTQLHELGHAHSVEAWHDAELVGGTYGVAIGGLFAAETMFYRIPDASKVALVRLVEHLQARGYALLDIQQLTPHTERFGAKEISRRDYLKRLAAAIQLPVSFGTDLLSPR